MGGERRFVVDQVETRQEILKNTSNWYVQQRVIMAHELATHFASDQESGLVSDITRQLHQEGRTYKDVIIDYFSQESKSIGELINSPFINAFRKTKLCSEAEEEFLSSDPSEEDFLDWLKMQIHVLADGLATCVNIEGVIEKVPQAIQNKKRLDKGALWREQNPEEAIRIQKLATQKAIEAAKPYVFTDELRGLVQFLLEDMKPEKVVTVLKMLGYRTDYASLMRAIRKYPDMKNSFQEKRDLEQQKREETILRVYKETGSIVKTYRLLSSLYTHKQVEYVILKSRESDLEEDL